MLSIERTKELLGDKTISDENAEEIRDAVRSLVEIIFEQWQTERSKSNNGDTL